MPKFKLSTVKELFPDKAKQLEEKDKKINYGKMFQLSPEKKKKVVALLDDIVEESKRQRAALMEIKEEAVRNYEGVEKITGPWDGSSNVSTMVSTIAADMIHAKLFPMVYNPDLLHFQAVEKNDVEQVENNKILMRWALTKDMEHTQDKIDEILHRLIVEGTIAVKRQWETYYTYVTRVVANSVTDKGEIKYKVKYDRIKRERERWIIRDIDHVYINFNAENEQRCDYIIDEVYYTLPMLREFQKEGLILEDVDMDEVAAAVEKTFDPDGTIKARHDASGLESYYSRIESYPIKTYEGYVKYDVNDDQVREECVFLTLPEQKLYLAGKPLHCVSRRGKRPWLIRPFLKRPGVIYGKGIPELVRHLHKEMNIIHNQRIDAGNMVIAPFFFYRAASGMDPEEITVKPATGIPLDDPQRDVFFPNYNASRLSVSFQEESILMDLVEKLTFLTPAMLGRETANRPTARGTLAVIAQGEQKFGLLAARMGKIISDLISDTRNDYEENLPEGIEQRILGGDGKPIWGKLSPENIAGDYDAIQDLDLTAGGSSFEKQADQIIFQTMANDPYVNQNAAFAWELRANYLLAMGKKNIEKLIGPKPDMELNEGDIEDENLLMAQERPVEVLPTDNHLLHMNTHAKFKREMGNTLTPRALFIITEHLLAHRMAYAQQMQELALIGAQNGQNPNGAQGAATPPGMGTIQGPRVEQTPSTASQSPAGGSAGGGSIGM